MVPYLSQLWNFYLGNVQKILMSGNYNVQDICLNARISSLCMKILRRFMLFGLGPTVDKSADCMAIFQKILQVMPQLIMFRNECAARNINNPAVEAIEKSLMEMMKTPFFVQLYQPLPFRVVLGPFLQFCCTIIFQIQDPYHASVHTGFVIRCISLVRDVVNCSFYQLLDDQEKNTQDRREANLIVYQQFLTQQNIAQLVNTLVSRYMVTTQEEIESWETDPEDFVTDDEDGTETPNALKNVAEQLYLALIDNCQDQTVPVVLSIVQNGMKDSDKSVDKSKILIRDACYNVMGWSNYYVKDKFRFSDWFKAVLKPEIDNPDPRLKLLRFRAAWVVGKWVEEIEDEIRPLVYETITKLFRDKDIVLRLTAVLVLKNLIDESQFDCASIQPYIDTIMHHLFLLQSQVTEEETQIRIVRLMGSIMQRMNQYVLGYAMKLQALIPQIWSKSEGKNLLRVALMELASSVIEVLGEKSESFHPFVLPLIKYCTDVNNKQELNYFLDHGLNLWIHTLRNAKTSTPDVLVPAQNLFSIMQNSYDNTREILKICESYVFLSHAQFMQKYIAQLAHLIYLVITEVKDEGVVQCAEILEAIISMFPNEAPQAFSKTFVHMLVALLQNSDEEESQVVLASFICVLSRQLLVNKAAFYKLLEMAQTQKELMGQNAAQLLANFIERTLDRSDYVVTSERKKVLALALLSLYPAAPDHMQKLNEQFGGVVNLCVQVLYESVSLPDDGDTVIQVHNEYHRGSDDTVEFFIDDTEPVANVNNCDAQRRKQFSEQNPINKIDVYKTLVDLFTHLGKTMGNAYPILVNSIDKEVMKQLQDYPKHAPKPAQQF